MNIKNILLIIVILFFSSTNALADIDQDGHIFKENPFEGWDDYDKNIFVASEILLITDWGQSLDINRKGIPDGNPILKNAPISTVNTYFVSWIVANYFITNALSGSYRKSWLHIITGVEVYTVGSNYAAGINIAF